MSRNWGDGSEVKGTDYSSRGPEFNSQQPHGGSSAIRSGVLLWPVVYIQTERCIHN